MRGDACDDDIDGDGYANTKKLALRPEDPNGLLHHHARRRRWRPRRLRARPHARRQQFTQAIPPAPDRYARTPTTSISILDLTRMANVFTQNVSACP